jgi:hypothetical protein
MFGIYYAKLKVAWTNSGNADNEPLQIRYMSPMCCMKWRFCSIRFECNVINLPNLNLPFCSTSQDGVIGIELL